MKTRDTYLYAYTAILLLLTIFGDDLHAIRMISVLICSQLVLLNHKADQR